MKLIKSTLLVSACLYGNLFSPHLLASELEIQDIGIKKLDALNITFDQEHLCPYPIQFEVKIFNDLKITGLKKFSYRWVLNGDVLVDNGRFEVYPSAYGVGYDKQKTIVHAGNKSQESFSGMKKLINKMDTKNTPAPAEGWYQFLVLPAGETNWHDAVKSNKASYKINCKISVRNDR